MGIRTGIFTLALLLTGLPAFAQEFMPPKPPPLDPANDFEEMEEDMMEPGDEGFRPPPPPPPQPNNMPNANNNNNLNNSSPPPPSSGGAGFGNGGSAGKVRFQIVEGEFFEKGKKRSRGKKLRASSSSN